MSAATMKAELRKAQAELAECKHALSHIIHCTTGTKLCPDCERLAKSAYKGQHWTHYTEDDK